MKIKIKVSTQQTKMLWGTITNGRGTKLMVERTKELKGTNNWTKTQNRIKKNVTGGKTLFQSSCEVLQLQMQPFFFFQK